MLGDILIVPNANTTLILTSIVSNRQRLVIIAPLRPKIGIRGIVRRTRGALPIPGSSLVPPSVLSTSESRKRTYKQLQQDSNRDDNLLSGDAFSPLLDTQESNNSLVLPISDIDLLILEAELEVLNRGSNNKEDFSGNNELLVSELGYNALLAARQFLEYQQQISIPKDDKVLEIGLNNDADTNTSVAIGPVGALIPISPVPILIIPPSIGSARIQGFGNN